MLSSTAVVAALAHVDAQMRLEIEASGQIPMLQSPSSNSMISLLVRRRSSFFRMRAKLAEQVGICLGDACANDARCAGGINALFGEERVRQGNHSGLERLLAHQLTGAALEQ